MWKCSIYSSNFEKKFDGSGSTTHGALDASITSKKAKKKREYVKAINRFP